MVNVVYLAFGPRRLVEATAFSALTLMKAAETSQRWRLVVYTDQAAVFERYGVAAEFVQLDEIRKSEGALDYAHRIKILALQHCAEHYDGHLLYLDGDTYWKRPAGELFARLAPGRSVMHQREWLLSNGEIPGLFDALYGSAFSSPTLVAGRRPTAAMWNAGVIGLSVSDLGVLTSVLDAADELYEVRRFHLAEQLAWSLSLDGRTEVSSADDVVFHYWAAREELTHRIVTFLRSSGDLAPAERAGSAFALQPEPSATWRPPLSIRARRAARAGRRFARSAQASLHRGVRQAQ